MKFGEEEQYVNNGRKYRWFGLYREVYGWMVVEVWMTGVGRKKNDRRAIKLGENKHKNIKTSHILIQYSKKNYSKHPFFNILFLKPTF